MSSSYSRQPLDPELAAIVARLRAANAPSSFAQPPAQARENMRRAVLAVRAQVAAPAVGTVEDGLAEHEGATVPVRIYRPEGSHPTLPTLVFFHGGGFVLGSIELMDDIARKLCRDVRAVVVSAGYRLAPEHRYPAAHEDALTAVRWARRHCAMLGGDPTRVAVVGESAGANLAACTALALRGEAPGLAAQLLIVPPLDMARDVAALLPEEADHPMLTPQDLLAISRVYLGDAIADPADDSHSPLRARDLRGLPPTLVAVAGHDPLRPEGLAYAARLDAAGVPVRVLHCGDMFHPFFGFFQRSRGAHRANDLICQALSEWLWTARPQAINPARPK